MLARRTWEHQQRLYGGFTSRYSATRLVWYEEHSSWSAALQREKTIKHWPRRWKINLIEAMNSEWFELSKEFNR